MFCQQVLSLLFNIVKVLGITIVLVIVFLNISTTIIIYSGGNVPFINSNINIFTKTIISDIKQSPVFVVIAWLSLFVPPESVPGRVILIIHLYLQHHGHPYDGYYHCP